MRFHRPADFMIIEVAGPSLLGGPGRRPKSAWEAVEPDKRRPLGDKFRSNRQASLRRAARNLLGELDRVTGPDGPETHETLRDLIAAVEARMKYRPLG